MSILNPHEDFALIEAERRRAQADAIDEKYRQRELAAERQEYERGLAAEAARQKQFPLDHSDRDSRWFDYDDPRELEEAKYRK